MILFDDDIFVIKLHIFKNLFVIKSETDFSDQHKQAETGNVTCPILTTRTWTFYWAGLQRNSSLVSSVYGVFVSIFGCSFLLRSSFNQSFSPSLLSTWADNSGLEWKPLSELVLIIRSLTGIVSSELNFHEKKPLNDSWAS